MQEKGCVRLRGVWFTKSILLGIVLIVAICVAGVSESAGQYISCTCCCSDGATITDLCYGVSSCEECCSTGCPYYGHGEYVHVGPCEPETPSSEVVDSRANRNYGTSYEPVGEPITTNSGAYYFDMSPLDLGGPMGLGFTLHYRSDEDNTMSRNPNDFPARDLATRFWWNPRCRAKVEEDYITFWLEDGSMVAFEEQGGQWQLYEDSIDAQPDNGQPIRYAMQETTNYLYLMSPIDERVYIFQNSGSENAKGRILYIMDRNGNQLIYTYADADHNNPSKIDDGLGRELNFTYSTPTGGEESLTKVTDQAGREITFEYEYTTDNDNNWSLRSVTDAMGQTTSFEYQAVTHDDTTYPDNIKKLTHPVGNEPYTQTYGYHEVSGIGAVRVDSQTDAYGNIISLDWDTDAYKMTESRPDGSTVVHEYYSHHSPPESWTDGADKTVTMDKNDQEQITSLTDRMGDTINISYHDESGKIASFTNAESNTVTNTYTAQNQTFTNPDNAETVDFTFYNLTRTDYPDGTNEQFTYDANGNMLTHVDQAGKTWTYTYNAWGQVLTATNPLGGISTYTYNADGTLASSMDSDAGTTTYAYDAYKRPNKVTHPDGKFVQKTYNLNDKITSISDENNHTYTYTYDANGNLTAIEDPSGNEVQYAYDLMDRAIEFTDRLGKNTNVTYDSMGHRTSLTDPNGIQATFSYDSRGWLNQTTSDGKIWQAGYDDEGVANSYTTPLGNTTTLQTNNLGYATAITDPMNQTTTFTRDSMGRITDITDPQNRITSYSFDNLGNLSSVTMPVIGTATYTRNDIGLISQLTDVNGSSWTFAHTNMGRIQAVTDPLGNIWQHTYDTRGRRDQTTYPDGTTLTRTYDDAGKITRQLYSGGTDLQFAYDELDRIESANNINFTRDNEGRIINTENSGMSFGATYDDGGSLESVTYNNGAFTVTYTYSATTSLLSRVTDNLTSTQIDFTYDNDQRLTGITRPNGVNTTYAYDNASRLTRIQAGSIIDIQYTLDAAGQVTSADMTVPLDPASLITSGTDTFTHDAASQVSTTGYTYDSRGRLTASPGYTYTWDGASRLMEISGVTLGYNGLGDLVTRSEGVEAYHYYYNYALVMNPIVAEQAEDSGNFVRYYVWTPEGMLLYMIDAANGNRVHHYHFDRTGSTLALTDATGTVTDSYAYTPYGKLLQHSGTSKQPFTFVGKWGIRQEGDSGTIYQMRARYYDTMTGRFLSREAFWPDITSPKSVNPYQYALCNPITWIDITGLDVTPGEQQYVNEMLASLSAMRDARARLEDQIRNLASDLKGNLERKWELRRDRQIGKEAQECADYLEDMYTVLAAFYGDPGKSGEVAKAALDILRLTGMAVQKIAELGIIRNREDINEFKDALIQALKLHNDLVARIKKTKDGLLFARDMLNAGQRSAWGKVHAQIMARIKDALRVRDVTRIYIELRDEFKEAYPFNQKLDMTGNYLH